MMKINTSKATTCENFRRPYANLSRFPLCYFKRWIFKKLNIYSLQTQVNYFAGSLAGRGAVCTKTANFTLRDEKLLLCGGLYLWLKRRLFVEKMRLKQPRNDSLSKVQIFVNPVQPMTHFDTVFDDFHPIQFYLSRQVCDPAFSRDFATSLLLLKQVWCTVEKYVRLSDHLKCCEERTLVILQKITSFVRFCSVHFCFHDVLQEQ